MQRFFEQYQIEDEVIAAGVSGGADSLALVWQLKKWAADNGRRIVALTVDHGLRPESHEEAEYVAALMKDWGIEHHILTWEGDKPQGDLEAKAREARYCLLADWCCHHGVEVLATGHHLQDQAETFLLRLQRGSGLYGLSSIQPVSKCWGITIVRPQLEKNPEELRRILVENGIEWKEDASNQQDDFERVKIRKYLPELEARIGISRERLAETASMLARSREFMEDLTTQMIQNQVDDWQGVLTSVSLSVMKELHPELRFRILAQLIRMVGKRKYTPRSDDILRLSHGLLQAGFRGCTLGDCEIFAAQQKLWIIPELRSKKILHKEDWVSFAGKNSSLLKANLPYKARVVLYNRLAK